MMAAMASGSFEVVGTLARLWRYPVKSMLGEQLTDAPVERRGLVGDRRFAVWDAEDKFGSCKNSRRFRRMDGLLDFRGGSSDGDAVHLVAPDGSLHAVPSPDADAAVRAHLGREDVRIMAEAEVAHHDAAPLHLLSTASLHWYADALEGVPADERRLRPNLVVDLPGLPAFAEDGWEGRQVRIGAGADAVLARWVKPTERCRTLTVEQDGLPRAARGLKVLAGRGLNLGVYLEVLEGGRVRVGDPVALSV